MLFSIVVFVFFFKYSSICYTELFPKYYLLNKHLIFVTQSMLISLNILLLSFLIERIYCRNLENKN